MGRDSATSLAPGFRFHPTDEELVRYYLKRKVSGMSLRFDPISVVDIYKSEPWDLPGKSKLKSRDLEWYFFSALDKKYGNSSRTNRATEKGYWKTTGKDRPVRHNSRTVGMKKTLVFHSGRAPRGARTNWVMHEYRLDDEELNKAGISQDGFVLCRVFQKSGTGPKNGEQYGAPFVEEEWEDVEELAFVPGQDQLPEVLVHGDDVHLEEVLHGDDLHLEEVVHGNDIHLEDDYFDQIHEERSTSENGQFQSNFCCGGTSNFVGESSVFIEDEQKPIVSMDDTSGLYNNECFVLPENELKGKHIKDEYFSESSDNLNPMDMNYFPDEPFACASDLPSTDGLYLETDDLLDSLKVDSVDFDLVDEYLTFFDEDQINENEDMSFDASEFLGGEVLSELPDEAPLTEKVLDDANESASMEPEHLSKPYKDNDASCSKQKNEASEMEPDMDHPFSKKVSNMLGCIPAPPAFASEFPSEDIISQLQTAAQASTSVHVTAGIIEIRSTGLSRNWVDNLLGKNRNFNLILPFCVSQSDVSSPTMLPNTESLHCKTGSSLSPCFFFFFMLLWVLILSVSSKVGSCIYSRRFTEL